MFQFGNNSGTPQQPNQQQQYNSSSPFGNNANNQHSSPGPFSFTNAQPQVQGTPQSGGLFGQRMGHSQSNSSPFAANNFGQQNQQSNNANSPYGPQLNHGNNQQLQSQQQPFGVPQSSGHQAQQNQQPQYGYQSPQQRQNQQNYLQQQTVDQQRQNLEQQSQNMTYLPGYLSRTKVVKPYKLPARQAEPGSPEAVQDADTSAAFGTPSSKSGKEETPSKGQASPVGRFSSSFFNEKREDTSFSRAGSAAPGTPWRGGRESIFGAGGLRGGRQSATPAPASNVNSSTPARKSFSESPGRALRSASTPPTLPASVLPTSGAMEEDDDDDAPPQERLEDQAPASSSSVFSASRNSTRELSVPNTLPTRANSSEPVLGSSPSKPGQPASDPAGLSDRSSALDLAHRTVLIYGYPPWMEKAVLELFAAAGAIEVIEAIDVTGSGSAQDQAATNANGPLLPCCTRVRYAESFQALQALRRNGEVVAGACVVGVRWEDENFHQIALTNGSDAVFRMEVFPSARFADMFKASSRQIAHPTPSASASTSVSAYSSSPAKSASNLNGQAGTAANTPGANDSGRMMPTSSSAYSAFGRPMSVINDPSVLFKPSASVNSTNSPFKAASLLFGTGAAAAPKPAPASTPALHAEKKSAGVLGRITDGIFGW